MSARPFVRLALPLLAGLALPGGVVAQDVGSAFDFYGQINLGIVTVDDGFDSDSALTDNDNSNSRIGFIYKNGMPDGSEFRFHFETGLGLTGSSSISGADNDLNIDWQKTELRKVEVIYQTTDFGTFSFGQGSTATDGTGDADFSGTSLVIYSGLNDLAGSQEFRLSNGAASGVAVKNVFGSFDGTRRFRVRYDTPDYSGFRLALSGGTEVLSEGDDNEYYDIGLKYARDYGDVKVDGQLGYSIRGSSEELVVGSLAMLHEPTGLNGAIAAGSQQEGDADYVYAKVGVIRSWSSLGSTAIAVDYYEGDDFGAVGTQSSSVGVGVVQKVDRYNLEVYAGYRTYGVDRAGSTFEDLDVTIIGARLKF